MSERFKYTEELLASVAALKKQGFKHGELARMIGCDPDKLGDALRRRRKGLIKGQDAKKVARQSRVRKLVELGYSPADIARELRKQPAQISRDFKEMGIDAEIRAQYTPRGEVEMH
jgi:hypothetical protein